MSLFSTLSRAAEDWSVRVIKRALREWNREFAQETAARMIDLGKQIDTLRESVKPAEERWN